MRDSRSDCSARRRGRGRRRLALALTTSAALLAIAPGVASAASFTLPAGAVAVVHQPSLAGCNSLTYGYTLNGTAHDVATKPAAPTPCGSPPPVVEPDITIGPFATQQALNLYLTDNTCGPTTYFSDNSDTFNHATVSGANPYTIDIADGGPGCSGEHTARVGANFAATLTIFSTSTAVSCNPNPISPLLATTCTATVTGTMPSGGGTPTGTVSFANGGAAGSFSTSSCTLSGSGQTASCSVTYTPTAGGGQTISTTYHPAGGSLYPTSTGTTVVNPGGSGGGCTGGPHCGRVSSAARVHARKLLHRSHHRHHSR